jgi:hypothetical protein
MRNLSVTGRSVVLPLCGPRAHERPKSHFSSQYRDSCQNQRLVFSRSQGESDIRKRTPSHKIIALEWVESRSSNRAKITVESVWRRSFTPWLLTVATPPRNRPSIQIWQEVVSLEIERVGWNGLQLASRQLGLYETDHEVQFNWNSLLRRSLRAQRLSL